MKKIKCLLRVKFPLEGGEWLGERLCNDESLAGYETSTKMHRVMTEEITS